MVRPFERVDWNVRRKHWGRNEICSLTRSCATARQSGGELCERSEMKKETVRTLRAFAIELVVYAALVVGYFFLVLHFLGGWLYALETHHVKTYASVAILLIIGQ